MPLNPNDGWVLDEDEGWELDTSDAPSTSSVDTLLSMPRGQGPTVGDEVDVPRDTTAPAGPPDDPFGYKRAGTSFAKGLGQGPVNLWNATAMPGVHGRVEMPEFLRTEPGDLAAFTGRVLPSAFVPGAGWASALGGGALGGAMESGTPEGALKGAAVGGALKGAGSLAMKAPGAIGRAVSGAAPAVAGVFENPAVQTALDTATLLGVPLAGKATAFGRFVSKVAKRSPKSALEALEEATGAVAPAAEKAPLKMAPPPVEKVEKAAGAATPTGPTPLPGGKIRLDDAIERLQKATSPQERGAIIRELAGGGKSKAERGAALSDATNKALDPEDATEAAALLKEAGSFEEALRIIREAPGNTVQDVIHLTRAVREASRRGGK